MEVMMMPQSVGGGNFMFNSTCNSPSGSAPQSPQSPACNYYFSAPSSPTNSSPFNRQISFAFDIGSNDIQALEHPQETIAENSVFDSDQGDDDSATEEDFTFDFSVNHDEDDDKEAFAFDFSQHEAERSPPQADKLIIKPLEPPPKKTLQNAVSFRHRKKYSDPSSRLMEGVYVSPNYSGDKKRSLKASNMVSERGNIGLSPKQSRPKVKTTTNMVSEDIHMERSSSSGLRYVKWKLADLSLFRSTSEGHEANKKYETYGKNMNEDIVKSSSTGRSGNTSRLGGGRKKKDQRVAGHELLNYNKMNRAAAEEMRRKTYLPYKKNLMGCMNIDSLIVEPSNRRINGSQVRRQS